MCQLYLFRELVRLFDTILKTSKFTPQKTCGHEDSGATWNSFKFQSETVPRSVLEFDWTFHYE